MAAGYSTTLRNATIDAITTATGNAGLLKLYDGGRPATGGTVTNLLGTFTCATPFAAAAAAGVLSPTLPANTTGSASGTATWARLTTSGGTLVCDLSVGLSASDIIVNTTTVSIGLTLSVTAWSVTAGNP